MLDMRTNIQKPISPKFANNAVITFHNQEFGDHCSPNVKKFQTSLGWVMLPPFKISFPFRAAQRTSTSGIREARIRANPKIMLHIVKMCPTVVFKICAMSRIIHQIVKMTDSTK